VKGISTQGMHALAKGRITPTVCMICIGLIGESRRQERDACAWSRTRGQYVEGQPVLACSARQMKGVGAGKKVLRNDELKVTGLSQSLRSSLWKWIAPYSRGCSVQHMFSPFQRAPRTARVGTFSMSHEGFWDQHRRWLELKSAERNPIPPNNLEPNSSRRARGSAQRLARALDHAGILHRPSKWLRGAAALRAATKSRPPLGKRSPDAVICRSTAWPGP